MNFLNDVIKLTKKIILMFFVGLIQLYRSFISPFFGPSCRFEPTCSAYFQTALKRFGLFKGAFLGFKRILRCNPWNEGGDDPVPPRHSSKGTTPS